jgi:hypothetical protein
MVSVNTILVASARWEKVTEYLDAYSQSFINEISGVDVNVLSGTEDTKVNFETAIQQSDPILIMTMGHGAPSYTTGYKNELILDTNNSVICADRAVYLFTCLSGQILAPDLINKGANSVIAYDKEFIFYIDSRKENPLDDEVAKGTLLSGFQVFKSMAAGKTAGEAFNDSQAEFENWVNYWLDQNTSEATYVLSALRWDKDHQKLFVSGSEEAVEPVQVAQMGMGMPVAIALGLGMIYQFLFKKKG